MPKSEDSSPGFSKRNCSNTKNVLDMLLGLESRNCDSQVHHCYNGTVLGPKSGRAEYSKGQRDEKK